MTELTQIVSNQALRHEAGVRIVLEYSKQQEPDLFGVSVPVEINSALESVIVSPFAQDWFLEVVRETTNKFGCDVEVVKSQLLSDPFF